MSYSLSLIACPAKSPLLHDDVDLASRAAAEAGAEVGAGVWLSPGEAWHVEFAGPPVAVRDSVRAALSQRALDINAFAAAHSRKRLLLADMDSTLIRQECIDELAAEVGLGAQVAAITERAMRGEIAFEPALRERVRLLEGLPTDIVSRVIAERIVLMPGAMTLVATMRAAGAYTALVSGGFTVFAEPIGTRLNIHEYRANQLVAMAGRITGTLVEPILGREAKADTLRELTARLGLDLQDTLAVGDGANDEAMIQLAGLGVAFRAKPALRLVAPTTVEHGDLTALLFLQGYRREEFVTYGEAS
jgi:phosphoserine phosphatase